MTSLQALSSLVPFFLATLLSLHGLRKRSLSPSGAIAAFIVGSLMLSGGLRAFGGGLLGLYLVGSRATKLQDSAFLCFAHFVTGRDDRQETRSSATSDTETPPKAYHLLEFSKIALLSAYTTLGHYKLTLHPIDGKSQKARLEEDYHSAGYRTATQVLCNSASGFIACVVWNVLFAPHTSVHGTLAKWIGADRALMDMVPMILTGKAMLYDGGSQEGWCPIQRSVGDGGLSRGLVFAALGHFACCLGDTLASELGILSRSKPRLITTWKAVPAGTNGGVSVGGTLASIAGGLIIGGVMGASVVLEYARSCSSWDMIKCVVLGAVLGGSGSLIDSFLGATIQETRYSKDKGRISSSGTVINGLNLLSNNQVNLISSTICAVIGGWIGLYF